MDYSLFIAILPYLIGLVVCLIGMTIQTALGRSKKNTSKFLTEYSYSDFKSDLLNPDVAITEILEKCGGKAPRPETNILPSGIRVVIPPDQFEGFRNAFADNYNEYYHKLTSQISGTIYDLKRMGFVAPGPLDQVVETTQPRKGDWIRTEYGSLGLVTAVLGGVGPVVRWADGSEDRTTWYGLTLAKPKKGEWWTSVYGPAFQASSDWDSMSASFGYTPIDFGRGE